MQYARWDLSTIALIDPHTEEPVATLLPLDKHRNAEAGRRTLEPLCEPPHLSPMPVSTENAVAPLLKHLIAEYAATGLPPAYLPFNPEDENA